MFTSIGDKFAFRTRYTIKNLDLLLVLSGQVIHQIARKAFLSAGCSISSYLRTVLQPPLGQKIYLSCHIVASSRFVEHSFVADFWKNPRTKFKHSLCRHSFTHLKTPKQQTRGLNLRKELCI